MRLGQDALVLTQHKDSQSVGFLSQTFLKAGPSSTHELHDSKLLFGIDICCLPLISYQHHQHKALAEALAERTAYTVLQNPMQSVSSCI